MEPVIGLWKDGLMVVNWVETRVDSGVSRVAGMKGESGSLKDSGNTCEETGNIAQFGFFFCLEHYYIYKVVVVVIPLHPSLSLAAPPASHTTILIFKECFNKFSLVYLKLGC